MSAGFRSAPASDPVSRLARTLEPSEWATAGIPLLRSPRTVVTSLWELHRPTPSTAVVAVLGTDERVAASASFTQRTDRPDGWAFRNSLLDRLRRVTPHDLRRRSPTRTAVLLFCRDGSSGWTDVDGAWMWGLRDACTLHGLRCGAYITLTGGGWQVLGEERGGRRPYAGATSNGTQPDPRTAPGALAGQAVPLTVPVRPKGPRSSDGAPPGAYRQAAAG
ncbi:hypothetical protein [Streptomyces sp. Z26]|uniref:hypothetical protein n=1 Tax=Streptomyces TaxID=1883 RepID=UPI000EF13EA8|nr:hypothetical protein [Streptomyces sp. Z26]RLL69214.1 hypothetical protein D7M15_23010 [Streptomyces sp. Z26]